jgi:hypothetical protein
VPTRLEIIREGNDRVQLVNDARRTELDLLETEWHSALEGIPGVAEVLKTHRHALRQAERDRQKGLASASALVPKARKKAAADRAAAEDRAFATSESAKLEAREKHDQEREDAETAFRDTVAAIAPLPWPERERLRKDAERKRDVAIRKAERDYQRSYDAAIQTYERERLAALEGEFVTVQAAVQQEMDDRERVDADHRSALEAANLVRADALADLPAAAAVQERFTLRRREIVRHYEDQVAAALAWMRAELDKLGA